MNNRELKFRVWSLKNKCFVTHGAGLPVLLSLMYEGAIKDEDIYQRYTGLKDSDSIEIYEGDIVKFSINVYGYIKTGYLNEKLCKIEFGDCEGHMAFVVIHTDPTDLDSGVILNTRYQEYMMVIGNIFENPELLKQNES